MTKKSKIKFFIVEDNDNERPVGRREFTLRQKEEIISDCISQSQLIKNKTFTQAEINSLVVEKILLPVKYKSKTYFKKDEIIKAINYIFEPPKLFSL